MLIFSPSKSQTRKSNAEASEEEEIVSQSEAELEPPGIETKQQRVGNGVKTQDQAPVNKKMQQQQQRQLQPQRPLQQPIVQQQPLVQQQEPQYAPRAEGYRPTAIRESRIKDRPVKAEEKDSAMSIKIQLDLEVEVCRPLLLSSGICRQWLMDRWLIVCVTAGRPLC